MNLYVPRTSVLMPHDSSKHLGAGGRLLGAGLQQAGQPVRLLHQLLEQPLLLLAQPLAAVAVLHVITGVMISKQIGTMTLFRWLHGVDRIAGGLLLCSLTGSLYSLVWGLDTRYVHALGQASTEAVLRHGAKKGKCKGLKQEGHE